MIRAQHLSIAMRMFQIPSRFTASHFDLTWRRLSPWTRSSVLVTNFSTGGPVTTKEKLPRGGPGTKATEAQLENIKEKMSESIPLLFRRTHNFADYHQNVVFEDNIRNVRTNGMLNYFRQVTQTRWFCMCRYTNCAVDVLKITHDTQDSKVCIRWTFKGVFLLSLMKHFVRYMKNRADFPVDRVIDGFSIMYVGDDGRVWKHVIEKMIPDTDSVFRNESTEPLIPTKIQDASLAVKPK